MTVTTNKGKTRGGGGGVREGGCIEGGGVTGRILILGYAKLSRNYAYLQNILACLFMLSRSA